MRYQTQINLSGTNLAFHQFRGASPNDPDLSGGGHQPRGYDEWAKFYGRYFCWRTSISVKILNETSAAVAVTLLASPFSDVSGYPTASDMAEAAYSKSIIIPAQDQNTTPMQLHMSMKTTKVRAEPWNIGMTALVIDNVPDDWFYTLSTTRLDNPALSAVVRTQVILVYHVMLYKRSPLIAS